MYFKNFPNIEYRFNTRGIEMVDIFRSVKFTKATLDSVELFETFSLNDGDTPEKIADQVYKDVRLYWLILLANDIIDINTEWPRFGSDESADFATSYEGGFAIYFDNEIDVKVGDYIALSRNGPVDTNQYGVVNNYYPDLNKIEVINSGFSFTDADLGSTENGASVFRFYIFRERDDKSFETLTSNLDSSGNDDHPAIRIDKLGDSPVYFKDSGRVISPLTDWTSSETYSPTGITRYTTTGKKTDVNTIARKYLRGEESDLIASGIEIKTYFNELPQNSVPSRQIKVLKEEFVSPVVNEITRLLNDRASEGTKSILSFSSNSYGN